MPGSTETRATSTPSPGSAMDPQLPPLAPLWGYDTSHFRGKVISDLMIWTRLAGRRLTDAEKDILMHHIARATAGTTYDRPIAAGLTAYFMHRSWAKTMPAPGSAFDVRWFAKRSVRLASRLRSIWRRLWSFKRDIFVTMKGDPRLTEIRLAMKPQAIALSQEVDGDGKR